MKRSIAKKLKNQFENIRVMGLVDGVKRNIKDDEDELRDTINEATHYSLDIATSTVRSKVREAEYEVALRLDKDTIERALKVGDIIAVRRYGVLYEHFAVYIGDNKVIHFADANGDKGHPYVHEAPLRNFVGKDKRFEILEFDQRRKTPRRRNALIPNLGYRCDIVTCPWGYMKEIQRDEKYHLYSRKETVARAKKIAQCVAQGKESAEFDGEHYNLITNNCENFAIWCRTGVSESRQVDFVLNLFQLTGPALLEAII